MPASLTVSGLVKKIRSGEISVTEALMDHILNIETNNPKIGAFIYCDFERAISRAEELQARLEAGKASGVLFGVPFAVSANVFYKGGGCNCGSAVMKDYKPDYSSTVVERLERAGAICVGTLNCEEFAVGGQGGECLAGPIRNPWNRAVVGGTNACASAVVSSMVVFAVGTDSSGELKCAASYNSVAAVVPGEGTISRYGVCDPYSSLTRVGITARDVTDCAAILQVISGSDGKDGACTRERITLPFHNVTGMSIGVPAELMQLADSETRKRILSLPDALHQCGSPVEVFSMPLVREAFYAHRVISSAEWALNIGKFRSELFDGGLSALSYGGKSRLLYGKYILMKENCDRLYTNALKIRQMVCEALEELFEKYNLIMLPAVISSPPAVSKKNTSELFYSPSALCNCLVTLSGYPSAAVPCGFTDDGLPIGCQIIGRKNNEASVLSAAAVFQKLTGYHMLIPKI